MEIRLAIPRDYIQLPKLLNDSFQSNTKPTKEQFTRYLKTLPSNQFIFVGQIFDEVVATHSLTIENKIIHGFGRVAHFEDLAVDKDYRGKGLAQKMLNNSIAFCQSQGCYKFIFTCSEDLVKFYEKTLKAYVQEISMRRDF